MTTVINSPGNSDGSGVVLIVGLIIAAVLTVVFIMYGLPAIRNAAQPQDQSTTNIELKLPAPTPTPEPAPAQ